MITATPRDIRSVPWTPPEDLEKPAPAGKVKVCLEVDADRFMSLLMDRICQYKVT